jgi:hypothetical protein
MMKYVLADAGTRVAAWLSRTKIQRQLCPEHFCGAANGDAFRRKNT